MAFCPVDGDEFRPGISMCPEHGVALVPALPGEPTESPPGPNGTPVAGAELGVFERFAAPVLIELLAEHGIRAQEADATSRIRRGSRPGQSMIIVWKEELDEARRIASDELPQRLLELEQATTSDPTFSDEIEQPAEPDPSPWGLPAEQLDKNEEVEEYDAEPIGFMESAVARVFLELCEEIDVGADTEYPLDEPPPAYARADGRVRVHVESVLIEHAMGLMKEELADELRRRGITYAEPLLEPED